MDDSNGIGNSKRETDQLALHIFSLLRNLPVEDKRLVLNTVRAPRKVDAGRALLIEAAVTRFDTENKGALSKRRYEAWRVSSDDRSLPSASFIAHTYGGTWSLAMDALGRQPSLDHAAYRLRAMGKSPEIEDILQDLRDCASEVGEANLMFRTYRQWAIAEQPHAPVGKNYLISRASFDSRFGSFNRAIRKAGLKPLTEKMGPWGRKGRYDQETAIQCLKQASEEIGDSAITQQQYADWRADQYRRVDPADANLAIPSTITVRSLFGSWPQALINAGLISLARGENYGWGQGRKMPAERIARDTLRAFRDLGSSFKLNEYDRWRAQQMTDLTIPRPPSSSVVRNVFGSWRAARTAIEWASSRLDPVSSLTDMVSKQKTDA